MHDEIENAGYLPAEHMLLYHINTGFPFVDDGAELLAPFGAAPTVLFGDADPARPESYDRFIAPQPNWTQQTFEHKLRAGEDGRVPVAIVNPRLGQRGGQALYVIYDQRQLPNFIEWRMMGEGQYAVGIEPCTNGFGRQAVREAGQLIVLQPGERRVYELEVGVLDGAEEIEAFRRRRGALADAITSTIGRATAKEVMAYCFPAVKPAKLSRRPRRHIEGAWGGEKNVLTVLWHADLRSLLVGVIVVVALPVLQGVRSEYSEENFDGEEA